MPLHSICRYFYYFAVLFSSLLFSISFSAILLARFRLLLMPRRLLYLLLLSLCATALYLLFLTFAPLVSFSSSGSVVACSFFSASRFFFALSLFFPSSPSPSLAFSSLSFLPTSFFLSLVPSPASLVSSSLLWGSISLLPSLSTFYFILSLFLSLSLFFSFFLLFLLFSSLTRAYVSYVSFVLFLPFSSRSPAFFFSLLSACCFPSCSLPFYPILFSLLPYFPLLPFSSFAPFFFSPLSAATLPTLLTPFAFPLLAPLRSLHLFCALSSLAFLPILIYPRLPSFPPLLLSLGSRAFSSSFYALLLSRLSPSLSPSLCCLLSSTLLLC
ncbi:hypothetical protein Tco_0364037 [Tanacetum coccineum]